MRECYSDKLFYIIKYHKYKYKNWCEKFFGNVNRQADHAVKFIFKKVSTSRETIVVLSSHFKERRRCSLFTIAYVNTRNMKFLESLAQKWILIFLRIIWIGRHFILIRILKLFVSRINEYAVFSFISFAIIPECILSFLFVVI